VEWDIGKLLYVLAFYVIYPCVTSVPKPEQSEPEQEAESRYAFGTIKMMLLLAFPATQHCLIELKGQSQEKV
jgi:hypothetical protein